MADELKLIIKDYQKSILRLDEALKKPKSVLIRDASIKRFELSFELAWKALKEYLKDQGIVCSSPKSCLSEAFRAEIISDSPLWLDMVEDRNFAVHIYSEKFADALFKGIKRYLNLFQELYIGLSK